MAKKLKPLQGKRMRSTRGYREAISRLRIRATKGEISWADCQRAVSVLRAENELLMAEQIMKAHGIDDKEPEGHSIGDSGGFEEEHDQRPAPHRRKRVSIKTGRDKHGNPVEERSVSIETSDAEDDIENDPSFL